MINIGLRQYIYFARLCNNIELEAKDFIEYGNREEVEDAILRIFCSGMLDYGDIEVDEAETELDIPDKFWEEWGTTEKTSIEKFRDYLAQYLESQASPIGNRIDYYCSRQEFHDIIKHLCNVGVVEVFEFQLNLAGNIINFKDKEYDERKTKTNID